MQNKELTLQKSMTSRSYHFKPRGFSLVELLLVLGIISIMASIVINSFSNAAQDSRNVLAKQQQATLQSAVNNWVASQIGGYEYPDPSNLGIFFRRSVDYVRNKYNYSSNYWTSSPTNQRSSRAKYGNQGRLELISDYLDQDTYQHLLESSIDQDSGVILSQAMKKTGQYMVLPDWEQPSNGKSAPYPKVKLYP